jgi:hypothetical protein
LIAYKVVTVTGVPNEFRPWFINGPCFNTTKYTVGQMTHRASDCGPLMAFPDYYDALSMYHRMSRNAYDTPTAIVKCDCRLSSDTRLWGPDGVSPVFTCNFPKAIYCDSIYVMERMPVGAMESYDNA